MFTNMFSCVYCHAHIQGFSITCPSNQLCAQICPYYNVWPGVFVVLTRTTMFKYDVARRVSKPHMPAKFHDLVLFGF